MCEESNQAEDRHHTDVYEQDAAILDELGSQCEKESDDDFLSNKLGIRAPRTNSFNASGMAVCDFAPNLSFEFDTEVKCGGNSDQMLPTFQESSRNLISHPFEKPRRNQEARQLRLVDGRLQVVGFPADLPESTKSFSKKRVREREREISSKEFWNAVVSFLLQ